MIRIIGAGFAGLLAANMLHNRDPRIYEVQKSLPNNHTAVLRFKAPTVGDVLNIPFKKVHLIKSTIPWRNPVADAITYADKNGGVLRSDRSITNMENGERYIAPANIIQMMSQRLLEIYYGIDAFREEFRDNQPTISTAPMPLLMKALDYPDLENFNFSYRTGVNITAHINNCDAYVSLLFPDPAIPFYRVSITGDLLIIEGSIALRYEDTDLALEHLGIDAGRVEHIVLHNQQYAKINPLADDDARKQFIYWASTEHNIYSLGRYAVWRPGLQLDHLVQDIRLIDKWISNKDRYGLKHRRAS